VDIDSFIQHYRPEWERLEQAVGKGRSGLAKRSGPEIDDVVRLYLRASAHLAEVRSRYADPRLEAYLNRLVATAHGALYGGQAKSWRDVVAVFGTRYRAAARRTVPYILVAAVIVVVVTAGIDVWVAGSRQAQAGVLPPLAQASVQKIHGLRRNLGLPSPELSTEIFFNNVQVTIEAFVTGIALCLGSIFFLVQNAVLLGSLGGLFQAAGKAGLFWPLILPHGFLEMSAICIGAGAGMRMGWAIIDPGDRTRGDALVAEARDAVFVVLGVIPAFGIAALIEGFITPKGFNPVFTISLGFVVASTYLLLLFGHRRRGGRVPLAAEDPAALTASPGI
jgi:uncharacterized membrane protein SpoIIM required for sporulation